MAARHPFINKYVSVFVAATGVTSIVHPAVAAPLPRLVVDRSADAADCPDAATLALAVERQMQRPALDSTNEPSSEDAAASVYEVHIARSADGYAATIRSGDMTRDLSDPGSTCGELADALALTLAILLDNEEPPPVSPAPPPKSLEPPVLLRPTQPPVTIRLVKPVRDWDVGVDVGLGAAFQFLSPVSFAFMGGSYFRYRKALFGVGIFGIPRASAGDGGLGTVDLQLYTGTLHGCGRILGKPSGVHLSLCGQTFFGAIHGQGRGFPINRGGTRPWFALGGMGLVEGPVRGRLGWSVRAGLAVPVISQRFTSTRPEGSGETSVTLFEPEKVVAFIGAGLRWTIF